MWTLAWRNLLHSRLRFFLAVLGIAFASFLMAFQGSLLYGFTISASRVIDMTAADIWIVPHGIRCFDYSALIQERLRDICRGIHGVDSVGRIATGFAPLNRPDGVRQLGLVIGMDDEFAGGVPQPRVMPNLSMVSHERVIIEETDADMLNVREFPADIEINRRTARIIRQVSGFSSFRGTASLFVTYDDAKSYLRMPAERTSYLVVKTVPGADIAAVRDALRARIPEVDAWTQDEFSKRARIYWLIQTGAGGALSLSALLGFLIGLAIISQTTYATTMENLDEYATLKAIGASRLTVRALVALQALVCGFAGTVLGFVGVRPAVQAAKTMVTWVVTPAWMYAAVGFATLLMCMAASIVSVRPAISVEPGRVFRV